MGSPKGPIVVGYDASSSSRYAVDWAAREAESRRLPLVVLFAWGRAKERTTALVGRQVSVEVAADAVAAAGRDRALALATGIEVRTRSSPQGAADALQELSAQATMIVLGDRHQRRLSGDSGSVVPAVAAHAECPVVFVPAGSEVLPGRHKPVVVGVDGSDGSDTAVQWAAELAARTRAELVLAAAWQAPSADHWTRVYLGDEEWHHTEIEGARHGAHDHVSHARGVVSRDHPDLRFREHVQQAPAATMLAQSSLSAALIAVGARGEGGLSKLLLGSVGRNVINRSQCPVAVLR